VAPTVAPADLAQHLVEVLGRLGAAEAVTSRVLQGGPDAVAELNIARDLTAGALRSLEVALGEMALARPAA
jgi:hypothetical protein